MLRAGWRVGRIVKEGLTVKTGLGYALTRIRRQGYVGATTLAGMSREPTTRDIQKPVYRIVTVDGVPELIATDQTRLRRIPLQLGNQTRRRLRWADGYRWDRVFSVAYTAERPRRPVLLDRFGCRIRPPKSMNEEDAHNWCLWLGDALRKEGIRKLVEAGGIYD